MNFSDSASDNHNTAILLLETGKKKYDHDWDGYNHETMSKMVFKKNNLQHYFYTYKSQNNQKFYFMPKSKHTCNIM